MYLPYIISIHLSHYFLLKQNRVLNKIVIKIFRSDQIFQIDSDAFIIKYLLKFQANSVKNQKFRLPTKLPKNW